MWYRDFDRGEKLFQAMREEVHQIGAKEVDPKDLKGWAPDDVNEMLNAWGFFGEYLPGPARLRWHPKHPDLGRAYRSIR